MQSQRIRTESQRIRSGVANEQNFFDQFKNILICNAVSEVFVFTAVSEGLQCIRHQIDGDCAENPHRLQYDSGECTESALRIISGTTETT